MAHPGPPGRGRFESSVTGAEAPHLFSEAIYLLLVLVFECCSRSKRQSKSVRPDLQAGGFGWTIWLSLRPSVWMASSDVRRIFLHKSAKITEIWDPENGCLNVSWRLDADLRRDPLASLS
jgi:hypothetical protein